MLAGWLFADLFLVLLVVMLASQPTISAMRQKSIPVAHLKHPQEPKLFPAQLEHKPVNIVVNVLPANLTSGATQGQAAGELLTDITHQLAAQHLQRRRAGFILVFASGSVSDIGQAIESANAAIRILRHRDPANFGAASGEGLWSGEGDYLHFQIFFFARQSETHTSRS